MVNGKFDYCVLLVLEYGDINGYCVLVGLVEKIVVGIFVWVFGFEWVGVDDLFFEFGGDLLVVMWVIVVINIILNVDLLVCVLLYVLLMRGLS